MNRIRWGSELFKGILAHFPRKLCRRLKKCLFEPFSIEPAYAYKRLLQEIGNAPENLEAETF